MCSRKSELRPRRSPVIPGMLAVPSPPARETAAAIWGCETAETFLHGGMVDADESGVAVRQRRSHRGSAVVEATGTPAKAPRAICSFMRYFWVFPVAVVGKLSTKYQKLGAL